MASQLAGGGAARPSAPSGNDKNKDKRSGGNGGGFVAAGSKSYDKAVNPGNQNLGLASANYSGLRGPGTGVDSNNPSNRAAKHTESSTGAKPEPQKNLPTGVTPLTAPKPMGATPFVEGADPIGIGARFLGGIGGAAMSALGQALSGEDPTQSMLGEHLGKQTGWSADPSMTPGRDRAQRGTTARESFDQTTLGSASNTAPGDAAARPAARDAENFSDIQMADRRRPGLKQMLETMI
jgi:hypothetical protein